MALQVWLPLNGNLNQQGLRNDITVTNNGATENTAGKIGSCYNFVGGAALYLGNNVFTSNPSELTVCAWMKLNEGYTTNSGLHLITINGNELRICLSKDGAAIRVLYKYNSGGSGYSSNTLSGALQANVWYHIAVSIKSGESIRTYINGVLDAERDISSLDLPTISNLACYVGSNTNNGNGEPAKGDLNDFRIYDHALFPREVAEIAKGLVLHYPLGDSYLEGTTNLVTDEYGITSTCYNGATSKYGYGANTDMYRVVGDFQGRHCTKVYMGTSGLSAYPYVYFNNQTDVGETKTLSFDYFPSANSGRNKINFYNLSTNIAITYEINGVKGTASNNTGWLDVNLGQWNHIVITGENVGSASGGLGYMQIGPNAHTSSTEYYWLFSNVQVELKDHATGYTPFGTTRAGGEVSDTSGFGYNGIINTDMVVSDNTARYLKSTVFDGVANCIKVPFNDMLGSSPTDYTVSVWTYKTVIGTKNYQTILGGPSGFELEARSSSNTNPLYRIHNWGGGTTPYEFNKWTLFTFVRTASDSKLYVNGELKLTGTSGTVPTGNYFIGAWSTVTGQNYEGQMSDFRIYATALTADQVKQLYEAPISLANNGTLFANELVEA